MKKHNVVPIPYSPPAVNMFTMKIYCKVPLTFFNIFKRWKHNRDIKRFRKNILNSSPSFHVLWQMADFIKIAEFAFFYDNSMNNSSSGLYSSKSFPEGQNGFRVFNHEFRATIKLIMDTKQVALEIERLKGDKSKVLFIFQNDNWTDYHTDYDELLLDQVIRTINCKIITLFDECYNKYMCL